MSSSLNPLSTPESDLSFFRLLVAWAVLAGLVSVLTELNCPAITVGGQPHPYLFGADLAAAVGFMQQ